MIPPPRFGASPDSDLDPARLGLKGYWLHRLANAGEQVPDGFVLPAPWVAGLSKGGSADADMAMLDAGMAALDGDAFAVRSSAAESAPGLLPTELSVAREDVPEAVRRVAASLRDPSLCGRLRSAGVEPEGLPLAVVVQVMVEGQGEGDFAAVAFSCDPNRGTEGIRGEYRERAAVAELVSGRHRARPVQRTARRPDPSLAANQPQAYQQLEAFCARVDSLLGVPCEVEVLCAGTTLWALQARPARLTPRAAVRVAATRLEAGSLTPSTALSLLSEVELSGLTALRLPPPQQLRVEPLARGLAASPGVASGELVLDSDEACELARQGRAVILARTHAEPEDVDGFRAARGVVTTSGGLTSHAAVIARGLGRCAVVGCRTLRLDRSSQAVLTTDDDAEPERLVRAGDMVTVDGHRGLVYPGRLAPQPDLDVPGLVPLLEVARPRLPCPMFCLGEGASAVEIAERLGILPALLGDLDTNLELAARLPAGALVVEHTEDLPRAQRAALSEGWHLVASGRCDAPDLPRLVRLDSTEHRGGDALLHWTGGPLAVSNWGMGVAADASDVCGALLRLAASGEFVR